MQHNILITDESVGRGGQKTEEWPVQFANTNFGKKISRKYLPSLYNNI